MVQQLSTNTFGTAKWIVSSDATQGTHTTIAGALTSASSGDTIFIRPGTYTENLTLKAGVNLVAYEADAITPNVTIVGKATATFAGTCSISGIRLQTNSDFFLVVSGSSATIVEIFNCYLLCSNNTGISFTSSSSSAAINIQYCDGNISTTGISLVTSTSAGSMNLYFVDMENTGGSTTASSTSSGTITLTYSNVPFPFSTSSTGTVNGNYARIGIANSSALTTAGTGGSVLRLCTFSGGTSSAISIGTGTVVSLYNCHIVSSNTNVVTGAGTLNYSNLSFEGTSTINPTVLTPNPGTPSLVLIQSQTANNSASISFTTGITSQYTTYLFICHGIIPITTGQSLGMQVSNNGGSTYAATGYLSGLTYWAYNSNTTNTANTTTLYTVIRNFSSSGYGNNSFYVYNVTQALPTYISGTADFASTEVTSPAHGVIGGNQSTTTINAFQFAMTSGNISGGTITLFGVIE